MAKEKETKGEKNQSYGNKLGYSIFEFVLKRFNIKLAYALLMLLIPYYVVLRPGVYRSAKPYLKRRFPNDSFLVRYFRMFKYVYTFGKALIDQVYFGFTGGRKITLEFERETEILELMKTKPVIFLMSHLGFWEVSMAGAARFNKPMNVLGSRDFDRDKRKSFYDIQGRSFNLINVLDNYGGMIEATNALLRGEVVALSGDRADQWRSKRVTFLGETARFPTIAPQLSVITGASVIALFTYKESQDRIRIRWQDISSEASADETLTKEAKIQKMLELYAAHLERHLEKHPYLWFNFFDFWKTD